MCKYVSVGKILNFHGIKGEAKVGYSKSQKEFLESLSHVYVQKNNDYVLLNIQYIKFSAKFAIIKFEEINSINDVTLYKNSVIFVKEDEIREKLDEDEFLIDELVGCEVVLDGKIVGVVVGVSNNGANDLLSVKSSSGKISLVPFVKAIVPDVDIKSRRVIVANIEGLIE